ncbi:hypothetical protein D0861_08400 [Hortaea werneckii]|uniref:Uncharacterized protein n=1 Tax=Hortaea werneckii TaxID=91943 RepID=A0A3M7EY10_HORWE|nr:hypothetical protein D0861_08400 [Hortaea werneckii]
MPGRLQNRTAIVTGASSGLGRAISLAFAAEGAQLCLVDLFSHPRNKTNPETGKADDLSHRIESGEGNETTTQEIQRRYGEGRAVFVQADMTVAEQVEAAVAKCVEVFGRVDIMAITTDNAGISVEATHTRPHGIHELSESDWDKTIAINIKSVFLGCKYALIQMLKQAPLPGLKDKGWIVNTSSIQGLVAYHNTPAYTAAKGAVSQLTKQVALDYAEERIHCNALCPGFLKTAMTQNLQNDARMLAEITKAHPFGGMGDPDDVARAAVFLASEDAAWVTGVNLPVDGGYMIM